MLPSESLFGFCATEHHHRSMDHMDLVYPAPSASDVLHNNSLLLIFISHNEPQSYFDTG